MARHQPDLTTVTRLFDPHTAPMARQPEALEAACCQARRFLTFYNWVSNIEEEYLGYGAEDIIYIFLFKISSMRADVDEWVWVVVGDVPPAYITCERSRTPSEALDGYIGAMQEWVTAARRGNSVANLIPVNVPANPGNAELLNKRLEFLDMKILPAIRASER